MISEQQWNEVKQLCKATLQSSLHFSIASVDKHGLPHITPIGSLMLGHLAEGQGHGCYFEMFTKNMSSNIDHNSTVCILAVNSSKWFWLQSLIKGRFYAPPAVRLLAQVGPLRKASDAEIQRWQKRVKPLSFSKGHRLMWRSMSHVRDVTVTEIKPVKIGKMTQVD
ncbi:pyridoxamine 5'-phosphate oxidase family protein [Pseudoalteromonas sp. S16_S37]|uniref:pyridoxamine 5'-phosphate oxidase family protein n=1 Tax=Pseudoalteromonas sp. S16_S37 TaxID=2720228 RepID=UPI0016809C78|nr:pyridoxamine 5'-phosphate oxidase family protein [Pseudoalteromonas sp. S16_S37]MBD1581993.1 pyridoxamine 5'-phosphate oxidase family protein [Pseudoalteromonas sp. S16_S37]